MANDTDLNYFVCTLGEAAHVPKGRPFRGVNHLIDEQSKSNPDLPAIGFYRVSGDAGNVLLNHEILTFRHVHHGVLVTAELLSKVLTAPPGETIGLLCASSPEFLFIWLACIRLGHPILLIAPQCLPLAIANLCQDCAVSFLLTDDKNEELGRDAADQEIDGQRTTLRSFRIPAYESEVFQNAESVSYSGLQGTTVEETHVAYFHHTSGTSSGKPRPIPQSHKGAVGVLPALDGKDRATFTTTPLYHGGPADIFRAWTSRAMIWLFPSKEIPITASNVVHCLQCADDASNSGLSPPVKYFTSVPYILQMMASDDKGLVWLQKMDVVGVGGSALPQAIGDDLVKRDVNLVSRFGSAECGFLLSSPRVYAEDKDWQYLRWPNESPQLNFEPRGDGLSELVVLAGWPHMAKTNREDGSFATSDLFEIHSHIRNAWRYHSRADSQLTLITGKKFDPASLEDTLVAATALIQDALVFGNGRPHPGVLLFRAHKYAGLADDDVVQALTPTLEKLNAESQSHSRLLRSMLVPMAFSTRPLEKSSKGTVIRTKAEERYVAEIDDAYEKLDPSILRECPDENLPNSIQNMVQDVLTDKSGLSEMTDLFSFGVDSVAGMQIRQRLQQYLPKDAPKLQVNVVEDCGTIKNLASYITKLRRGQNESDQSTNGDEHEYMLQLVEQFSNFAETPAATPMPYGVDRDQDQFDTIVLTGASGAFGAHVLSQLRTCAKVSKIYCLVRGASPHAARERVGHALKQRQLPPLDSPCDDQKVAVIQTTLGDTRLGLNERLYEQIARETTIIMHLAWSVNFRWKLRSFVKDNIAGVKNLIGLALASPRLECPNFMFCSSVASVINHGGNLIPETILDDPFSATDLGYSQSKWVAEHICARASKYARLRGKVSTFRVGQLSGDSETGIWNTKEAWPMMLSTVKLTGSLPALPDQVLDWLPVNLAAAALIEGAGQVSEVESMRVIHVLNNNSYPLWRDLLEWLGEQTSFEIVAPLQWVRQLEAKAASGSNHPALQLLDHWKKSYEACDALEQGQPKPKFSMTRSRQELSALRRIKPIDKPYFEKLWAWLETNM